MLGRTGAFTFQWRKKEWPNNGNAPLMNLLVSIECNHEEVSTTDALCACGVGILQQSSGMPPNNHSRQEK
jgi:hypothetical protein